MDEQEHRRSLPSQAGLSVTLQQAEKPGAGASPPLVPQNWRPEWRKPKERAPKRARAKKEAELREPLPARSVLNDEALRVLRSIMMNIDVDSRARVTSAGKVLDATGDPSELLLALMDGDKDAYERFLRAELATIEASRKGEGTP
jgi:hypothetical protein